MGVGEMSRIDLCNCETGQRLLSRGGETYRYIKTIPAVRYPHRAFYMGTENNHLTRDQNFTRDGKWYINADIADFVHKNDIVEVLPMTDEDREWALYKFIEDTWGSK